MSQCSRKVRSVSTFSSLQQPPSINPIAQWPVKVLRSSMGDLSKSTSSTSFRMRSSMSSRDIWQPKQPAMDVVAIFGLAMG